MANKHHLIFAMIVYVRAKLPLALTCRFSMERSAVITATDRLSAAA